MKTYPWDVPHGSTGIPCASVDHLLFSYHRPQNHKRAGKQPHAQDFQNHHQKVTTSIGTLATLVAVVITALHFNTPIPHALCSVMAGLFFFARLRSTPDMAVADRRIRFSFPHALQCGRYLPSASSQPNKLLSFFAWHMVHVLGCGFTSAPSSCGSAAP